MLSTQQTSGSWHITVIPLYFSLFHFSTLCSCTVELPLVGWPLYASGFQLGASWHPQHIWQIPGDIFDCQSWGGKVLLPSVGVLLIILRSTGERPTRNNSPAPNFSRAKGEKPGVMHYFIEETQFWVWLPGPIFSPVFTLCYFLLFW